MTLGDALIKLGFVADKSSISGAEKAMKGLKSTATKLLGAIGIGFSIKGIVGLAEAAADAEALSSQFSQVFGDLEEEAYGALERIAEETGVSVNRMKSSFSQIASFAKTTGMETSDALELTDRAMVAVADSAAFYDRSLEDVTASLQSFLKGNYENDAALGLSCTETTRNAAANALYGKSFANLSEAQKQLTLLQMVEDANAASGALGQASRESDTWTNQLGNLKQNLTDLKATLGSAFLEHAVEILKGVSEWIADITSKVEGLTGEHGALTRGINRAYSALKKLKTIAESCWKAFRNGAATVIGKLGGVENALKLLAIMAGAVWLAFNATKILNFLAKVKGFITAANLKTAGLILALTLIALVVEDFINFLQGNDSVLGTALDSLGIDSEEVRETVLGAFGSIQEFFEEHLPQIKATFEAVWSAISTIVSTALGAVWSVVQSAVNLITAIWNRWGPQITNIVSTVWGLIGTLFENGLGIITGIANAITALLNGDFSGAFEALKGVVKTAWNTVCSILRAGWTIIKNIFQIGADFITGILTAVLDGVGGIVSDIATSIMDGIQEAIDWLTGLPEQALQWGSDIIQGIIDGISPVIGDIYTTITDGMQEAIDWITALPEQALQWGSDFINGFIDGITGVIGGVTNSVKGIAEGISSFLHFSVPDEGPLADYESWMPDFMSGLASGIQSSQGTVVASVKSLTDGIAAAVKDGMQAVIDWMGQMPGQAEQWGEDIIGGLIHGISGAVGALATAVKGVADTITSYLHFSTPDEGPLKDYESWMPDFMSGLASGVENSEGTVLDVVKSLAEDIAVLGQSATASVGTALSGAVTNNTSSRSVTQNVNISNQFNGDKTIQKKAAAAADRSAQDITVELSRALAYVR